ncbi:MAG: hypothetical protein SGARI_003777 [Bacillariaceae sp.]
MGVGKLLKLIPHPVMLGFVNGLAIVMTRSQLMHFKTACGAFMSLTSPLGASTYGIAALTMILVKSIPKATKAVPPSLGAVAMSSLVAKCFSLPSKTLADVAGAATFKGGWSVLPTLGLPSVPLTWGTVQTVAPYALTMASVGVLESLLTMQILDDMADDGKRGSTRKECIGQGAGNIMSGLTQGIGGCVLLGQSIINMQSVQKDLAMAVLVGSVLSALGFAYKQSTSLTATYTLDDTSSVKTYRLSGPLFFGSTRQFEDVFASAKSDPSVVRLDFSESRILDHSAVESLETLSSKYTEMGKTVKVEGLCMDSTKVLSKYCKGRGQDALPFQFAPETNGDSIVAQNDSSQPQAPVA